MNKALFAGSFDPPTYGHINIIERAARIFSHLDIVIGVNKAKNYLFSDEERLQMLQELTTHIKNVDVHLHAGLTVEKAIELKSNVIIRGVRNASDFTFEFDTALANKVLHNDIETLFLPTEPHLFVVKSSYVKEIASHGGDVSSMVSPSIEKKLREKYV